MRQYRITSENILPDTDDDCYLAPDDPIHALKKTHFLGGLGSEQAMATYMQSQLPKIAGNDKGRIAREKNIKPGTPEWFDHWFSNK